MKTLLILTFFTSGIFFSCSKTHTCACTTTYTGEQNYTTEGQTEIEGNRTDAQESCNANNSEQTIVTETKVVTCELQ